MTYYIIYKITNKINGKIYIGSHKTNYLNDNYMGSGKYLTHAIQKHGIENFTKEILYVFDTPEQMYAKEAELVNENFLVETNTYNLKVGGFGGWDYINNNEELRIAKNKKARKNANKNGALEKAKKAKAELMKDPVYVKQIGQKISEANKGKPGIFKGKNHSQESRKKMSLSSKGKTVGEKNSQYGTIWITNGQENKKIKKDSIIPSGWYKGRKIQTNNCG
jgi:hypothetical protein